MPQLRNLFIFPLMLGSFTLLGCDSGGAHGEDGHDHDHEAQTTDDGHDHSTHDHATDGHLASRPLGDITIDDVVLTVAVGGKVEPNATLHVDIDLKLGDLPVAVRVWVGDASGIGSLKAKASGNAGHYHADAVCPGTLSDTAALWIEVEDDEGNRDTGSLPLG